VVAGAYHQVGAEFFDSDKPGGLGIAAGNGDLRAGREPPDRTNQLARLRIGNMRDRAGVDDVCIRFAHVIDHIKPGTAQPVRNLLGISEIQLAPKREDGGSTANHPPIVDSGSAIVDSGDAPHANLPTWLLDARLLPSPSLSFTGCRFCHVR